MSKKGEPRRLCAECNKEIVWDPVGKRWVHAGEGANHPARDKEW